MSAPRHGVEITVLHVGWRHKVLLAAGGLFGGAVGIALALFLPAVYESNAQVLIVKKRPDVVTGLDTRQFSAEDYMAPVQELLKSSLILEKAVRTRDLGALPSLVADDVDRVDVVRKGLTITPVKSPIGQPNVFKLAFRSRVLADTSVVLTAILDSFRDFIDKKYQSVSTDTVDLILREKESLQRTLADQETAYRQFREKCPLLSKGKDGLDLRQETLNTLQTQRSALLLRRVEIEGQLAAIDAALRAGRNRESVLALLAEIPNKSSSGEPVRDKQTVLQEQLLPLLLEERKLLETHGAKHPDVIGVRSRIEATRRLLSLPPTAWKGENEPGASAAAKPERANSPAIDPIDAHVQVLKHKHEQVKVAEEQLAKAYQLEQDELRRLAGFEIQDETFRTSIALSKQMYEALVKRLGEASLLRNVGGYEVEAMEAPSIGVKVAPSMRLFAILGGFVGGLLALGLAFRAEARRHHGDQNGQVAARVVAATVTVEEANGNGNGRGAVPHRAAAEFAAVQDRLD